MRYSQGEQSTAIARYTLAIDRPKTRNNQNPGADFIPCVAFGRSGEFAEKYFHQGMRVLVSGRIQTGSYVNKDGQKIYTTEIIVATQEFADSAKAGNGDGATQNQGNYGGNAGNSYDNGGYDGGYGNGYGTDANGFMNIPDGIEDEGLPFN